MNTKSNKNRTYVPCVESLHSWTEVRTHWTSTQDCSDLNQSRQRTFSLTSDYTSRCSAFCLSRGESSCNWCFRILTRLSEQGISWSPSNAASLSRVADGMGGVWSDNQTGQLRDELITVAIKSSKPSSLVSKWLRHEKRATFWNDKVRHCKTLRPVPNVVLLPCRTQMK